MQVSDIEPPRAVQFWLYAVAALIFLTLVVGGATRLTESGLSITEWKPVTGVLPPLSAQGWQDEFAKYREIPQYRELNRGMTVDEFKTIYWWEWTHRLLARTVGAAFLLPMLFFLWRGMIPRGLKTRLWIIFGAGAALGAVGWQRVAVPAGVPPDARVSDLCRHLVDGEGNFAAASGQRRGTIARECARNRRSRPAADLSRRAGGRCRCRQKFQHMAADRRCVHPVRRPPVV
jgi:hypothetical protein